MKKHLPGLDGLRAVAALTVLIFHIDQNIRRFSPGMKSRITAIGTQNYAVTIFFVLSGFLITFLLLNEKQIKGQINLKRFYLRRILKIWPLYFLIVAITFIIGLFYGGILWPSNSQNYIYYILLVGNLAFAAGRTVQPLIPFWSIGVEEQFYLFWPVLIRRKNVIKSLLIFLALFSLLKVILRLFVQGTPYFLIMETRFSSMAIGAIGAWLYFENHRLLKIIFNPALQVGSWLVLLSLYFKSFPIGSVFNHEIYSGFFLVIIMNSALNEKAVFRIDNKVFNFLGKISYGIYCWHLLVIILLAYIINQYKFPLFLHYKLLIFLSASAITIAVAYLSYILFERRFLLLKDRFQHLSVSRPELIEQSHRLGSQVNGL